MPQELEWEAEVTIHTPPYFRYPMLDSLFVKFDCLYIHSPVSAVSQFVLISASYVTLELPFSLTITSIMCWLSASSNAPFNLIP